MRHQELGRLEEGVLAGQRVGHLASGVLGDDVEHRREHRPVGAQHRVLTGAHQLGDERGDPRRVVVVRALTEAEDPGAAAAEFAKRLRAL